MAKFAPTKKGTTLPRFLLVIGCGKGKKGQKWRFLGCGRGAWGVIFGRNFVERYIIASGLVLASCELVKMGEFVQV